MIANLPKIYGEPVTIVNRLDAKHSALKQDAYYQTVIHDCMVSEESSQGVSSTGTVTPSTVHRVQIPVDGAYVPYREWRDLPTKEGTYTLRAGDYVIKGIVTEPMTASNIRTVISDYEPDAFQVKSFRELTVPDVTSIGGLPAYRFSLEG